MRALANASSSLILAGSTQASYSLAALACNNHSFCLKISRGDCNNYILYIAVNGFDENFLMPCSARKPNKTLCQRQPDTESTAPARHTLGSNTSTEALRQRLRNRDAHANPLWRSRP